MFSSSEEAIKTYREELHVIDQDLPGFVIAENGEPVGRIVDNDSVVFFNFRGDRAIEISRAFEEPDFDKFDRVYSQRFAMQECWNMTETFTFLQGSL